MPREHKPIDLTGKPDVLRRQSILRPMTVERYIVAVEKFQNSARRHRRAHPMSRKVAHPYRYNWQNVKHTVVIHQSPRKPATIMQPNSGVLTQSGNEFATPKRTGSYQPAGNKVTVRTPGGHKDQLMSVEKPMVPRLKRVLELDSPVHEVTTCLSYKQLSDPIIGQRIDNRRAHGGLSADQKVEQIDLELLSEHVINSKTHHEYTHDIAGRWGVVTVVQTGKKRDPAAASSTFIAPAAFNTEMILFERFADFLVFINHHRYGMPVNTPSVEYTMRYQQDPKTFAITFAEIKIKDLRTGIEFTHHWDNPSAIADKPSAALFLQWLALLKKALDRNLGQELKSVPLLFSKIPNNENQQPVENKEKNRQKPN